MLTKLGGGRNQHRGRDGGRFQNYNSGRGNFNNPQNPQSWNPNPAFVQHVRFVTNLGTHQSTITKG